MKCKKKLNSLGDLLMWRKLLMLLIKSISIFLFFCTDIQSEIIFVDNSWPWVFLLSYYGLSFYIILLYLCLWEILNIKERRKRIFFIIDAVYFYAENSYLLDLLAAGSLMSARSWPKVTIQLNHFLFTKVCLTYSY